MGADAAAQPAPTEHSTEDFADRCRWVADAHAAGDVTQTAAALCSLYASLIAREWLPSARASLLLDLHAAALDAGVEQLVDAGQRER